MKNRSIHSALIAATAFAAALALRPAGLHAEDQNTPINVVAVENFYGDVASQLGGDHVHVISIMSDPNVDPHEYEADPKDAVAVASANLVIQNGADYDNWMPRLLNASPNSARLVITAADVSHDLLKENPHVWYSLSNIKDVAAAITKSYESLDPAGRVDYETRLKKFDDSLQPIQDELDSIRHDFAGTPVGLTETIFLYQTTPMQLNVLTPWEFQHAIAEGNDPPVQSIAEANSQVSGHQVKVLIYNVQTVTPITTHLQEEAKDAGIPIVGVSETMPPGETYQSWMLSQLQTLDKDLKGSAK
ncbi:MAG TPA: zinc ABC transporter substrate-binding protein [Tepidisphaeraceae bacterium]|nr:zinc ABC transporter substrate-binding protein [Tepidisphaeraceae bacterium]